MQLLVYIYNSSTSHKRLHSTVIFSYIQMCFYIYIRIRVYTRTYVQRLSICLWLEKLFWLATSILRIGWIQLEMMSPLPCTYYRYKKKEVAGIRSSCGCTIYTEGKWIYIFHLWDGISLHCAFTSANRRSGYKICDYNVVWQFYAHLKLNEVVVNILSHLLLVFSLQTHH